MFVGLNNFFLIDLRNNLILGNLEIGVFYDDIFLIVGKIGFFFFFVGLLLIL